MANGFDGLGLQQALLDRLAERGMEQPTAVQTETIPAVLAGRDVVARSQTGTGKTLAFVLPILERLDAGDGRLQAMVLAPTQELAMQLLRECEAYGEPLGIRSQALIGGAALSRQVEKLKQHPQLVVGTPGRVLELLRMRKLSLQEMKTLVIDEVDQVFALGGAGDVEAILRHAGKRRQLLFFSATIPDDLRLRAERWMNDPLWLQIAPQHVAAETLEHLYVVCEERDKLDTLRRLVLNLKPKAALVFINETDFAAEVERKLTYEGLSIGSLYGDAGKQDRSRTMQAFRTGKLHLLLATDVAARGLDLSEVTHVFNLDVPGGVDPYVHRAGRTGRMGRPGTVITIVMPKQRFIMDKFAKALGVPIRERTLYGGALVAPQEAAQKPRATVGRGKPSPGGQAPRERAGASAHLDGKPSPGGQAPQERAAISANGGGKPANGRSVSQERAVEEAQRDGKPARGGQAPLARPAAAARSTSETGRPAPRQAAPAKAVKPASPAKPKERKAERERDRKNKGAPRWLKEKRSQDGNGAGDSSDRSTH